MSQESEATFQQLVRILEAAVRAGATSVGLERDGLDLTVVHYVGNRGQTEATIPKESEQALVDEIVNRADLAHKPRGEIQVNLLGKDYKVVVDDRSGFGESAFNLLLKKVAGVRK